VSTASLSIRERGARAIASELDHGSSLIDQLAGSDQHPWIIAEGAGEFRPREKAR
jgi:hypothetical protein